jgi:hypothetical protein
VECKSCKDLPQASQNLPSKKGHGGCGVVATVQREEKGVAGQDLGHLVGLQVSERD